MRKPVFTDPHRLVLHFKKCSNNKYEARMMILVSVSSSLYT